MKVASLILGFLFSCFAAAQGHIHIEPKRHPHPRPRPIPHWVLETRAMDVEVTLKDRYAVTEVEQVFYNPGPRLEEGTYIFPLPKRARVESFTMFINGVETRAELLDAKKAASIYNEIVRKARDPALLEYMGGELFKARVFPIEARSEKKIRLSYRQVLETEGTLTRYNYPLRASRFAGGSIGQFSFSVLLETRTALKTVYSPSHRFEVRRDGDRKARLSFEADRHKPQRDVSVLFSMGQNPIGLDVLAHAQGKDRFFWLTATPDLRASKILPKDMVFVFDTSGSMAGDKLRQAKAALRFCVENLNPDDRFQIIRFSTEAEALSDGFLRADETNRLRATDFIDRFQAIGGTNLEDALKLALASPVGEQPQSIILITDGKPTIGERREQPLLNLSSHKSKRLFTFGIGFEINTHLLDKLAEASGGSRSYATPEEDLELKLSDFYTRIQSPVLSDLKLTASGVTLSQIHPNKLPDLFRGIPMTLFGRYRGAGKASIRLEGRVNGHKKAFTYAVHFPEREPDNGFIEELWAQRRVGFLLDEIRLHGEDRELKDEVVRLARRYGILTPYTSYLILEDSPIAAGRPMPRPLRHALEKKRESFKDAYDDMSRQSGEASVRASEEMRQMSQADQAMPTASPIEDEHDAPGLVQVEKQIAAGRSFYKDNGIWIDATLEGHEKPRVVAFAEQAYFQLLNRFPELAPILALGERVRFIHKGQTYEITVN